jgi:hypothetical protein
VRVTPEPARASVDIDVVDEHVAFASFCQPTHVVALVVVT